MMDGGIGLKGPSSTDNKVNVGRNVTISSQSLERLHSVFLSIDTDGSNTISLAELKSACAKLSMKITPEDVSNFMGSDANSDGVLDFNEFQGFYIYQLQKVFNEIDTDKSGEIDVLELQNAFEMLGFQATQREVRALLGEVDKDKNAQVDFEEFCNFFCSLPSPDLRMIVQQWAAGLSIDTGADFAPPPMPPASLVIWKALLAGGVAGIISRTATAPLEKIKILAQTGSNIPLMSSLRSTWRHGKLQGIFAGNGANCMRVFPFAGLVCLTYANIAHKFPLDNNSSMNVVWRMGTGGLAGFVATLLTHPVDVVRARLTVQNPSAKMYKGVIHGLMDIASKEKLQGLYRGVGPTLMAIVPFMGVQQATYDLMKQHMSDREIKPSAHLFFICGSFAGAAAQTAVYPLEVIRRRMQVLEVPLNKKGRIGAWSLWKSLSPRQLFSGLSATYLKVMPAAAVSLLVRDAILGRLKKQ